MTTPANAEARRWQAIIAARAAHQRREASVDEYRAAIAEATRTGATYAELAAALGITRQAVRQLRITNH